MAPLAYSPPGRPLRVVPIPLVAWVGPGAVWTRQGWLLGWNLTASQPGTAAVVSFLDGDEASGDLLALLRIPADSTNSRTGGPPTWPIDTCLTIDPGPTPISGAVLIGELWTPPATRTST